MASGIARDFLAIVPWGLAHDFMITLTMHSCWTETERRKASVASFTYPGIIFPACLTVDTLWAYRSTRYVTAIQKQGSDGICNDDNFSCILSMRPFPSLSL